LVLCFGFNGKKLGILKEAEDNSVVADPIIWFNEPLFNEERSLGDKSPVFWPVSPVQLGQP